MKKEQTVFGIDLGTTCSSIGHLVDGLPVLIDIDGATLVPSVVRFPKDRSPIVGAAALNQLALYADETLRSTKRHIGTSKTWTIHGRTVTPVDAATAILRALAGGAERATGTRPEQVVITVPAWFSHSARADTQRAAADAGLTVLRLINEPTAAALARDSESEDEHTYLVYDFGGGTFDASLIVQSGPLVEVKASHGDVKLGGDDLDESLLTTVLERLKSTAPAVAAAIEANRAAHEGASMAVREAKHALATELTASCRAPFIADAHGEALHLEEKLDRDDLEPTLSQLVERTFSCIDSVLRDAEMSERDVHDVLLVGGSTRVPGVREALRARYGWEGDASVPVQDAVALGATVQAGLLAGVDLRQRLIDVTPHALSVTARSLGSMGEEFFVAETITPRNVTLPCKHTHRFWTIHPLQLRVHATVMQGSNPNPLRNLVLGEVALDDLPPAPDGDERRPIGIELSQDLSGVVSVRMSDELTGRVADVSIALSGVESEEARDSLLNSIDRDDLIPGDGTDPDPFCIQGRDAAQMETTTESRPDELADAARAFEQIEAAQTTLATEHADVALALRRLATRGSAAIAANRHADAMKVYEELADLMFESGVYL